MRFMILVKASPGPGASAPPDAGLLAEMATYREQLAHAGVLLDATSLRPRAAGWRVRHGHGAPEVLDDGPVTDAQARVSGYTLIQVRSREEALEWARRFPAPRGAGVAAEVEVRPLVEPDGFAPGPRPDRWHGRNLQAP